MNFTSPFSLALGVIIGLSLLGVPLGHAMIGGSVLYLYLKGMDMGAAAEQLLNGTYSSFLLLAIPLFILAATIMRNFAEGLTFCRVSRSMVRVPRPFICSK